MAKGCLCIRACVLVVSEQLLYEVLRIATDTFPARFVETEFACADLLHDILVILTVKGGIAGKENIRDHTGGPDITLA